MGPQSFAVIARRTWSAAAAAVIVLGAGSCFAGPLAASPN